MSEIYDTFASLCAAVIRIAEDDALFVRYTCISQHAKDAFRQETASAVPMLFTEDGTVRQLTEEAIDRALLDALDAHIATLTQRRDGLAMIVLLELLDTALAALLRRKEQEFQQMHYCVVLNKNREATGIGLLPRCGCVWERKHRLSHSYDHLDNFLHYFLLLENAILGEIIDIHYFLSAETFPHFRENNGLRIAATPLRLAPHYVYDYFEEDSIARFRIVHDPRHAEADDARIWEKICQAAAAQTDIIVFPEMVGTPQTPASIAARLRALDPKERQQFPGMTILPSYFQNGQNTAVILDREGRVICRQTKQNPFRKEKDGQQYLEAIKANCVVNIFHYEGIGRFAVLICKDMLTTHYLEQIMRCFKLTLLFVPSNSTGSYDFRQSFDVCAHDDCNVVWINTCAALVPGKEENFENIGHVRKRIGRRDDDSQRLTKMPICPGAFQGECAGDCLFFETIKGV